VLAKRMDLRRSGRARSSVLCGCRLGSGKPPLGIRELSRLRGVGQVGINGSTRGPIDCHSQTGAGLFTGEEGVNISVELDVDKD